MAAVFGQILAVPMVAVSFYVVGPVLLYIGLLVFGLMPFGSLAIPVRLGTCSKTRHNSRSFEDSLPGFCLVAEPTP